VPGHQTPCPGQVEPVGLGDHLLAGSHLDQAAPHHRPVEADLTGCQVVDVTAAGHPGQISGGFPGDIEPGRHPVDQRPGPIHPGQRQLVGVVDQLDLDPTDPAHDRLQPNQLRFDLIRSQLLDRHVFTHTPHRINHM